MKEIPFQYKAIECLLILSRYINIYINFILLFKNSRRYTAESVDSYRLFGSKLLYNIYPLNNQPIIIDTSTMDKYKFIQKICLTLSQISLSIFTPTAIQLTDELLKLLSKFIEVMFEYLKHPSLLLSSLTFEFWNMIIKNDNNYYKLYIYYYYK